MRPGFAAHAFSNSPDTNTGICKVDAYGPKWSPDGGFHTWPHKWHVRLGYTRPTAVCWQEQTTKQRWVPGLFSKRRGHHDQPFTGRYRSQPLTVNAVNATPGAIGTTPDGDIVVYPEPSRVRRSWAASPFPTLGGTVSFGGMSSTGQWRWAVPIYADYTLSLFRSLVFPQTDEPLCWTSR